MDALTLFVLLMVGHLLADYPLQGDFLSTAKNRHFPLAGVPWYQALGAHAGIHGAFVGLATGSLLLGVFEAIAHALIDDAKCAGKISFNQDQALHVLCKLVWVVVVVWIGATP